MPSAARRRKPRKTIFTLTVLNVVKDEGRQAFMPGAGKTTDNRTWGWTSTLKQAERCIPALLGTGCKYCVIEEFPDGPLAIAKAEHWYKLEYTFDDAFPIKFTKVEKPKSIRHIVSFGLG